MKRNEYIEVIVNLYASRFGLSEEERDALRDAMDMVPDREPDSIAPWEIPGGNQPFPNQPITRPRPFGPDNAVMMYACRTTDWVTNYGLITTENDITDERTADEFNPRQS